MQFGGNSNINLTGNIYAPTAAVTFQGNPTINSCGELIAASADNCQGMFPDPQLANCWPVHSTSPIF